MNNFKILITSPWILFILFIILIVTGILYVRFFPLSNKKWKCVEVISLMLSNVGIIMMLSNNRIFFYEQEMNKANHEIEHVESYISSMISIYLYERAFYSNNIDRDLLDLAEKDYRLAGDFIKLYKDSFLYSIKTREYYDIVLPNPPKSNVEKNIFELEQHIEILKKYIPKYNNALKEYNYYKERISKTYSELTLELCAPLLIVVSLSIQIVSLFRKSFTR